MKDCKSGKPIDVDTEKKTFVMLCRHPLAVMIACQVLLGSHKLWHLKHYRAGLLVKTQFVWNLWFSNDLTGIMGGKKKC